MKPAVLAGLDAVLARARETDFYRARVARLDAAGWFSLAPTTRGELVRDQLEHLPFGSRRGPEAETPVRVGSTGSGADLLALAWSANDLALAREAGTRLLARIGIAPATAVANTLPGALVSPGSLLLGDVVEEHGALDVPLGAIESDAAAKGAWELVDRVEPAVLCLETATAARFFAAAPPRQRAWLSGILWLRRGDTASAPAGIPAEVGFRGWQRLWLAVAEAASFVAATCTADRYHVDERLLAESGPHATLLLTPLDGDAALLRYDSGIAVTGDSSSCACGNGHAFDLA